MNIENAKTIRLPKVINIQAIEIIHKLDLDRQERIKVRGTSLEDLDNHEDPRNASSMKGSAIEGDKKSDNNIKQDATHNRQFMESYFIKKLKRICCCLKPPQQIIPDATITVEKVNHFEI